MYILFIRFDTLLDTACINEASARDKEHDMFTRKTGRGAMYTLIAIKWNGQTLENCVEVYFSEKNLKIKH